mmetsp:Transcript_60264/g.168284  ORF Transcript_60264/g.168284 Transcript_60264/m.168284 type:complete len:256 (-) Transcript_60264:773-1540(-)
MASRSLPPPRGPLERGRASRIFRPSFAPRSSLQPGDSPRTCSLSPSDTPGSCVFGGSGVLKSSPLHGGSLECGSASFFPSDSCGSWSSLWPSCLSANARAGRFFNGSEALRFTSLPRDSPGPHRESRLPGCFCASRSPLSGVAHLLSVRMDRFVGTLWASLPPPPRVGAATRCRTTCFPIGSSASRFSPVGPVGGNSEGNDTGSSRASPPSLSHRGPPDRGNASPFPRAPSAPDPSPSPCGGDPLGTSTVEFCIL